MHTEFRRLLGDDCLELTVLSGFLGFRRVCRSPGQHVLYRKDFVYYVPLYQQVWGGGGCLW